MRRHYYNITHGVRFSIYLEIITDIQLPRLFNTYVCECKRALMSAENDLIAVIKVLTISLTLILYNICFCLIRVNCREMRYTHRNQQSLYKIS